tara:strand:- start:268 stop:441 length:174 start_codon:yes stop_codon:yes gene_type:complete
MVDSCSNMQNNEQLVETLEIVSDPKLMNEIAEGIEAYESGKGKNVKQLRKELGLIGI